MSDYLQSISTWNRIKEKSMYHVIYEAPGARLYLHNAQTREGRTLERDYELDLHVDGYSPIGMGTCVGNLNLTKMTVDKGSDAFLRYADAIAKLAEKVKAGRRTFTVHHLHQGTTLCGFGDGKTPTQWPEDHIWISISDEFLDALKERVKNKPDTDPSLYRMCDECAKRRDPIWRKM